MSGKFFFFLVHFVCPPFTVPGTHSLFVLHSEIISTIPLAYFQDSILRYYCNIRTMHDVGFVCTYFLWFTMGLHPNEPIVSWNVPLPSIMREHPTAFRQLGEKSKFRIWRKIWLNAYPFCTVVKLENRKLNFCKLRTNYITSSTFFSYITIGNSVI